MFSTPFSSLTNSVSDNLSQWFAKPSDINNENEKNDLNKEPNVETCEKSESTKDASVEEKQASFGNMLYDWSKSVTSKAALLTKSIEENTILGSFSEEQSKFIDENRNKSLSEEAATPPWCGYEAEDDLKEQILNLSLDKRNFLRNPPSGVNFPFDYTTSFPIALASLEADENLEKIRFELVPKQLNEEIFWRNYFYRVSLLKQSAELREMARSGDKLSHSPSSQSLEIETKPEPIPNYPSEEPQDNEDFVSDTYEGHTLDTDDIKKEREQLQMTDSEKIEVEDDVLKWEAELQQELEDYEVVPGEDIDNCKGENIDLEAEIMKQLESEP